MNASHPFMNHQNARLIFALGEAAGRAISGSICSSAGYLLDLSSDQAWVSEQGQWFPDHRLILVSLLVYFLYCQQIPMKTPQPKNNELTHLTSTAWVANAWNSLILCAIHLYCFPKKLLTHHMFRHYNQNGYGCCHHSAVHKHSLEHHMFMKTDHKKCTVNSCFGYTY